MSPILTIDIAHPPMSGIEAERILSESLRKVQLSKTLRVMKIIHGYGSSGKGGLLKTLVLDWIYKNRARIINSIQGEDISLFNTTVQELCVECKVRASEDLGFNNDGITIIWVK